MTADDMVQFDELHEVDQEVEAVDSLPISEDEKVVIAGEVAEEPLPWHEVFAKQMKGAEATGLAKAAVQAAAEKRAEEDVDLDKMEVQPNRKAMRDAMRLRGAIQPTRSRVRRRMHRALLKRGYWR